VARSTTALSLCLGANREKDGRQRGGCRRTPMAEMDIPNANADAHNIGGCCCCTCSMADSVTA
jgi:hypothetical protein